MSGAGGDESGTRRISGTAAKKKLKKRGLPDSLFGGFFGSLQLLQCVADGRMVLAEMTPLFFCGVAKDRTS